MTHRPKFVADDGNPGTKPREGTQRPSLKTEAVLKPWDPRTKLRDPGTKPNNQGTNGMATSIIFLPY